MSIRFSKLHLPARRKLRRTVPGFTENMQPFEIQINTRAGQECGLYGLGGTWRNLEAAEFATLAWVD